MKHFNLYKRIKTLYPELKETDFFPDNNCILLINDGDGEGDYIQKWNHPTLSKPSDEDLKNIVIDESLFEPEPLTPQQKLEAAGLSIEELKELLGL
jgi:hypothetical protein